MNCECSKRSCSQVNQARQYQTFVYSIHHCNHPLQGQKKPWTLILFQKRKYRSFGSETQSIQCLATDWAAPAGRDPHLRAGYPAWNGLDQIFFISVLSLVHDLSSISAYLACCSWLNDMISWCGLTVYLAILLDFKAHKSSMVFGCLDFTGRKTNPLLHPKVPKAQCPQLLRTSGLPFFVFVVHLLFEVLSICSCWSMWKKHEKPMSTTLPCLARRRCRTP